MAHAALDDAADFLERAGNDEKDVLGIDGLAFRLAAGTLELERGLQLALDVVGGAHRHLGLLHQLQQRSLHAAPADIAAHGAGGRGDLVHLVDVNDAVLRQIDVAIGPLHQLAHQVLDVAANVAGLAEFCRVGLDEWNADQFRDVLDEVGLSDAGRAQEDDVLLRVFGFAGLLFVLAGQLPHVIDVVVMVADGNGQDPLGVILADDVAVQVRLDVARQVAELERLAAPREHLRRAAAFLRRGAHLRGNRDVAAKLRFHEFAQLLLQFFRGGESRLTHLIKAKIEGNSKFET